jgi:hypothetical protein
VRHTPIARTLLQTPSSFTDAETSRGDPLICCQLVMSMDSMFHTCTSFNGDLSNWTVSSALTKMGPMFYKNYLFTAHPAAQILVKRGRLAEHSVH